jgi:Fic family protein
MRAEFHEMPGLRLTFRQAQRLWNLDEASCRRALDVLVDSGFLARFATGTVGLPPIV